MSGRINPKRNQLDIHGYGNKETADAPKSQQQKNDIHPMGHKKDINQGCNNVGYILHTL